MFLKIEWHGLDQNLVKSPHIGYKLLKKHTSEFLWTISYTSFEIIGQAVFVSGFMYSYRDLITSRNEI